MHRSQSHCESSCVAAQCAQQTTKEGQTHSHNNNTVRTKQQQRKQGQQGKDTRGTQNVLLSLFLCGWLVLSSVLLLESRRHASVVGAA